MKLNTKSSVTLPASELRLLEEIRKKIGAKSKVEVIRRGLLKLKEVTDRESLAAGYARATEMTHRSTLDEMNDLELLSEEGLDKT